MKLILSRFFWILFAFLLGLLAKFYYDYQQAKESTIEVQRKLDSLRLENTFIEVRDTVFVPDTVYQKLVVEKKEIIRDTMLVPLILTDTVYVDRDVPYFISHKYYSDRFIDANITAYSLAKVDSFKFGYNLKIGEISKEANINLNIKKSKNNCKDYLWKGAVIGLGTYVLINTIRGN